MKTFKEAVQEVKLSLAKLALFQILLNAFIVFLVSYLVLFLFGGALNTALWITFIYAIIFSFRRLRRDKIRTVESRYPDLEEKFRTAVDNQFIDNPVVNELQAEVLRDLKRVEEASFFNSRETYAKLGGIVVLCFLIFFFSPISLAAIFHLDMSRFVPGYNDDVRLGDGDSNAEAFGGGAEEGGTLFGDADIYGTPFLASPGEKDVFVTLNPGGFEMNVRKIRDATKLEFDEAYPDEVFGVSGGVFEENIPVEQQELVKNYFKQLAEGE